MNPKTNKLKKTVTSIDWIVGKSAYTCKVHPSACPFCKVRAIVELPPPMAARQQDGTTWVCHPGFGGCNHGFALMTNAPTKGKTPKTTDQAAQ